ncbi:MAG: ATP-grasp domain-containing protein [Candidatus Sericytochromatia bacterium]
MQKKVLFVSGLADDHQVKVIAAQLNGLLSYQYSGTCDIYNYLHPPQWQKKMIMLDTRDVPLTLPDNTDLIVNQIAEVDTHHKTLQRLQNRLKTSPQIPVFNPPQQVAQTRRDRVYQALRGLDGVVVPQTVRIQPRHPHDLLHAVAEAGMHFPVILKAAGLHGGKQTVRLNSAADLDELHALALDGRDYYLIQYLDSAHDGVYAKYRLVMLKGELFANHFRFSDHWLVHYYTSQPFIRRFPAYFQKELELFAHFETGLKAELAARAQAIYQRIPIDFVGIDGCLLPDGRWLIFEMNANMLLLNTENFPYLEAPIGQLKEALFERMQSMMLSPV